MSPTIVRSVCPYDCPDTCGLLVEVEDGRAVRVSGDPAHPLTRGLLCPKMNHYERTVHSPRRLTTPLLRTGAKGEGRFEPLSWGEAIERICSRWKDLIAGYGGECILPYSYAGTMGLVQRNSGHPFFHKLGASRLERTICSPAKEAGWKAIMGDTAAMDLAEIGQSDLVILWGINAAATSIHVMRDALAARRDGARLWALDTYRTPTCEKADEAFIVRPGGDGALALGMMHVIVREGLADRAFIRDNVLGFEEFAEQDPARLRPRANVAGLRPAGRRDRTDGAGVCGRKGALHPPGERPDPLRQRRHDRPHHRLPARPQRGMAATRRRRLHRHIHRQCLPPAPGHAGGLHGAADASGEHESTGRGPHHLGDPPVMSLYVYHSNPAAVTPDQNAVIKGLERDDLFTVVHERFLTDTARYADIVLPATSSLEQPDLYRCYGGYHSQRCAAAIPPVGEAKSNWEVFSLLAAGMGWDEPFFRQSADDLIEQLLDFDTPWRDAGTTRRLREGEPVLLTPPSKSKQDWKTPSGRIEIRNDREPEPLPRLLATHAAGDGFPLRLQPATTPYALNSSFYEQDDLREKQECMALMMHPQDAAARGLADGRRVTAYNGFGEVEFVLKVTERVPAGTVVTEGVWWREFIPGRRGVNALTSQRLTDSGRGSTLYDVAVEVRGK